MNLWTQRAAREYALGAGNWAEQRPPSARDLRALEALSHPQPRPDKPATITGWQTAEVRPSCAAPGCAAQRKLWKRTARPVIEGLWTCGRGCSLRVVEALVQRQLSFASADGPAQAHRHRIPLGLVLLRRGAITHEQLRCALEAQQQSGTGRIGYWLEEVSGVAPEKILQGLAAQWNRPVLSSTGLVTTTMALVAPPPLREQMGLLPLRVAGTRILYCGFEQTLDGSAVAALERMSGLRVEAGVLAEQEFRRGEERLRAATAVNVETVRINTLSDVPDKVLQALWDAQPVASRLVLVNGTWWLRMWLEPAAVGAHGLLPATGEDVLDVLFQR